MFFPPPLHLLLVASGAASAAPGPLTLRVDPASSVEPTAGAEAQQLPTLEAAAAVSAALRVASRDIVVELASGLHRVPDGGLRLAAEHSPSNAAHTVTWRPSSSDEPAPRVHGGVLVTNWTAASDPSLPKGALVAPAPAGLKGKRSRQFYVGGRRGNRTRVTIGTPVGNSLAPHNPLGMKYNDFGHLASPLAGYNTTSAEPLTWSNPGDVEFGYLPFGGISATWEEKRCPCKSVSKNGGGAQVAIKQPCLWNLLQSNGNRAIPSYVENVRQHLAHPGEYYYDVLKGEVIYLPQPGEDMSQLEAFVAVEETLVHHDGSARHTWEGVAFEYATWLRPAEGEGYVELQAAGCVAAPFGEGRPPATGPERCPPIVHEGSKLMLGCPSGQSIDAVIFASFGTPAGNCKHGYVKGQCDDVNSTKVVSALCLGKQDCTVNATIDMFGGGDPCGGTGKTLAAQVHCSGDPPPPPPCGTYTAKHACSGPKCAWNTSTTSCEVAPLDTRYTGDDYTIVTPGNVAVTNGTEIRFVNSTFRHMGAYGSSALGGSQHVSWEGCTFHDTSAGAVVLGDLSHCNATDPAIWDGNFTIKDCKMLNLPVEFTASTAIFGGYVGSVRIEHNHVANTSYSGISLGWGWGNTGCPVSGDTHVSSACMLMYSPRRSV